MGSSRESRSPMSRSSPPAWGITAGSCTSGGASSVGSAEELGGKKGRGRREGRVVGEEKRDIAVSITKELTVQPWAAG